MLYPSRLSARHMLTEYYHASAFLGLVQQLLLQQW
jgi:hypothetical protein